jgi:hypothetical protein
MLHLLSDVSADFYHIPDISTPLLPHNRHFAGFYEILDTVLDISNNFYRKSDKCADFCHILDISGIFNSISDSKALIFQILDVSALI